jgi:FtsH-binding integral membrane protein
MTFFDCIYLKVSKFYSRAEKKEISGFSGLAVLGLMQSLNVFTLFLIYCVLAQQKPPIPSWWVALLIIALIFANGTRYYSISLSSLQEKWDEIAEKWKNILNSLVSIYIVGSTILWVILLVYVGNKKY